MNKIDVTFLLAPKISYTTAPASSRIISSNLIRNKKLNVKFSDCAFEIFRNFMTEKRYLDTFKDSDLVRTYSELNKYFDKYTSQLLNFSKIPDELYDYYIDRIDTEYVIASALSLFSFDFITRLLLKGKKVILGGAIVNTYNNINDIRNYFFNLNVPVDILNDNLIIVNGFVDLYTDFYEIIKNWKDIYLPEADYDSIYDCDYDYIMDIRYKPAIIVLPLSCGCYWGKCKYCDIFNGRSNKIKLYYNKKNAKRIQTNLDNIISNYENGKCLQFHENYLSLNTLKFIDRYLEIPNKVEKVYGYTGIKYLTDERYVDYFSRLSRGGKFRVSSLFGTDTVDDFSLSQCDRGFRFDDVKKAIINICSNMDKNFNFSITIIKDLPYKNKQSIEMNYEYLIGIIDVLSKYVSVKTNINYLMMYPRSKFTESIVANENKYLKKLSNRYDKRSSGIHYFINKYMRLNNDDPIMKSFVPYYRVDENNNILPPDDEIFPYNGIVSDKDYDNE